MTAFLFILTLLCDRRGYQVWENEQVPLLGKVKLFRRRMLGKAPCFVRSTWVVAAAFHGMSVGHPAAITQGPTEILAVGSEGLPMTFRLPDPTQSFLLDSSKSIFQEVARCMAFTGFH